jgi:F-type H+-transporting ATPase subunit b
LTNLCGTATRVAVLCRHTLMRTLIRSAALIAVSALPAAAQDHAEGPVNIMKPEAGLMVWTLIIFGILFFILAKYAFGPLTEAVRAREQSLRDALEAAKRDRAESERLLAEYKAQLDAGRAEAQKLIADGRAVAEKTREQMLEDTRKQQDELLARAKRDIESEKAKAIADLRRDAVDLAIKGASRVIEKNLDDATNRKIVEDFLGSVSKS